MVLEVGNCKQILLSKLITKSKGKAQNLGRKFLTSLKNFRDHWFLGLWMTTDKSFYGRQRHHFPQMPSFCYFYISAGETCWKVSPACPSAAACTARSTGSRVPGLWSRHILCMAFWTFGSIHPPKPWRQQFCGGTHVKKVIEGNMFLQIAWMG